MILVWFEECRRHCRPSICPPIKELSQVLGDLSERVEILYSAYCLLIEIAPP